jgi:hypothetical protein
MTGAPEEAADVYLRVFKASGCRESAEKMIRQQLMEVFTPELPAPELGRQKRQRRPRLDRMIAQAEKATGKSVASITTADGVTLTFGEGAPAASNNPWLADLEKRKQ